MPNILLTNFCNQKCSYCFARKKMESAEKKEISTEDIGKIVDFLKKNNRDEIRLMGGEPTLHPQFEEIIEHILSVGLHIRLFTNGIFPKELAYWLAGKGETIKYAINLSTSAFQKEDSRMALMANLKILKQESEITAAITIDSLDFNSGEVMGFIQESGIKSVRIGIANVLAGDTNWLMMERYKDFGLIISALINRLKQAGILHISLNCGFTPCMFEKNTIEKFLQDGVLIRGWGCKGKKGGFDISTDLSAFPCFVLENLKVKNIFDFKNLKVIKKFMDNLLHYTIRESSLFLMVSCKKCPYRENLECFGPCLGYIINSSNNGNILENFQKKIYFRFIRHLLYFSRNWIR